MDGKWGFFPNFLNDMSFEERKKHKEKLLREEIKYMYDNSPEYYQVKMKECGAEPGDIQTIEDTQENAGPDGQGQGTAEHGELP